MNPPSINGIAIFGSPGNHIGSETPEDANVIYAFMGGIGILDAGADDNVIKGNRIGISPSGVIHGGSQGVGIFGGNGTIIGSVGTGGNRIATENGISVGQRGESIANLTCQGNRIGLEPGGTTTYLQGMGIAVFSEPLGMPNLVISDNWIAGYFGDLWMLGGTGARIERNRLGLKFNGEVALPSTSSPSSFRFGLRLDYVEETRVTNNVIAGHTWDVLVSGSSQVRDSGGGYFFSFPDYFTPPDPEDPKAGNSIFTNNQIGIVDGQKPEGTDAKSGFTIFSEAPSIRLVGNTIAGHADEEVLLMDGSGHILTHNFIGTDDGADYGSQVGVRVKNASNVSIGTIADGNWIGRNALVGVDITGNATGTQIVGNKIGSGSGNTAWPNGIGILIARDEERVPTQNTIEGNVISGNIEKGILLGSAGNTVIKSNRIGITSSGAALPNKLGIEILATPTDLIDNIVAYNTEAAIRIVGDTAGHPVKLEGGSIHHNGDGEGDDALDYAVPPFDPPTNIRALKSVAGGGNITLVFAAPAAGVDGDVTYEFFGNRPGVDPQGEVLIFRRTVNGRQAFSEKLEVAAGSTFAGLTNFRATVTIGGRTSGFSTHTMSDDFEWPVLRVSEASRDGVKIVWTGSPLFKLKDNDGLVRIWSDVDVEPALSNGEFSVTVPFKETGGGHFFRLELDTDLLFSP